MDLTDGAVRFTDRADVYDAGRPPYPAELFAFYRETFDLTPESVVADVGAGTGIHAAQLSRTGVRVMAVEPNPAMRTVAEARFAADPDVEVVDGSAEATGLEGASVDLVVAAQAFHWFDPGAFRVECGRILRHEGGRALVWNVRNPERNAFTAGYEALLHEFGRGYAAIRRRWGPGDPALRFFDGEPRRAVFDNDQRVDRASVKALLDSASYAPARGSAARGRAQAALDALIDVHADRGRVVLAYDTVVLWDP